VGVCPLCGVSFRPPIPYAVDVNWQKGCVVLIPCLNEADAIGAVISAVKSFVPNVLVVDDGSTDGTGDVARAASATVLRHPQTLGKGAALRAGWDAALQRGFEWALCMDGDGQHAAADIPKFLGRGERGDVALVAGERMHAPNTMPLVRRITNRFMSWHLSRLVDVQLTDTQCGFRLLHLPSLARLQVKSDCFEIESEVLIQFARARFGIAFVPIQVIYADERSKIRPLRDTLRWWNWLRKQNPRGCNQ
jgi:glycosyltransferase involved in cell wall biosynthesis